MPSRNPNVSVYPPPAVARRLGGYSSRRFNLALHCWAYALERALRNARICYIRSQEEWDALALVFAEYDLDPALRAPGPCLGEHYSAARALCEQLPDLAACLHQMVYDEAWAVLWVVRLATERYPAGNLPAGWWRQVFMEEDSDED